MFELCDIRTNEQFYQCRRPTPSSPPSKSHVWIVSLSSQRLSINTFPQKYCRFLYFLLHLALRKHEFSLRFGSNACLIFFFFNTFICFGSKAGGGTIFWDNNCEACFLGCGLFSPGRFSIKQYTCVLSVSNVS